MWALLGQGILLGVSAGVSPGPLFALVIAETLHHGTKAGLRVALVPLVTDMPIVPRDSLCLVAVSEFCPAPRGDILSWLHRSVSNGLREHTNQAIRSRFACAETQVATQRGHCQCTESPPLPVLVHRGCADHPESQHTRSFRTLLVHRRILHLTHYVKSHTGHHHRSVAGIPERSAVHLPHALPRPTPIFLRHNAVL